MSAALAQDQPLLSVQRLCIHFTGAQGEVQATRDIDFDLKPGERVGIVGESGCGKTVTGLSILGLLPAQSSRVTGRIEFEGRNLTELSARDMREFVLADFEQLHIPQWAARAEYFKDDFHAELVWIPYLTYDNIGEPGDDFYPYPPAFPGLGYRILDEKKPRGGDSDDAAGVRLGWIVDGWDINGYYYRSTDVQPAFQRSFGLVGGVPTLTYTPTHNRIQQWGLTVGKDIGDGLVFKAEAIYTMGRRYDVLRLSDADGLVRKDTLDYVLGLDWTPDASNRLNLQFFQRFYQDHDPDMVPESVESGVSLFYSTKVWGDRLEPEITLIESLNRGDWLLRPRLTWNVSADLKASFGADILNGPPDALFGRFTNGDRVYAEVRYDF